MTDSHKSELPNAELSVGIWYELERALEGKNGFGGDVAEIYAYRLLPEGVQDERNVAWMKPVSEEQGRAAEAEVARIAARNLTWIVRHFAELHEGVEIGYGGPDLFHVIDPRSVEFPPFSHRIHVRVSQERRTRRKLAGELRALWERAKDVRALLPEADFARWSLATKDLLDALDEETSR